MDANKDLRVAIIGSGTPAPQRNPPSAHPLTDTPQAWAA